MGQAAWWLLFGLGVGYLGLLEQRRARAFDDGTAYRRAALTRLWAGLAAVVGLSVAMRMDEMTSEYVSVRVVPPVLGDVAILLLCAVLIERAFRREATPFLWAAALGMVIALTDLNVSYIAGNTWVALLIEGAILLAVGVSADHLRRVVRGPRPQRDTDSSSDLVGRGAGPV